jgi:hypothetical protein
MGLRNGMHHQNSAVRVGLPIDAAGPEHLRQNRIKFVVLQAACIAQFVFSDPEILVCDKAQKLSPNPADMLSKAIIKDVIAQR